MPSIEEQLKESVQKLGSAFEEFKKANNTKLAEIKTKGVADVVLREKVEKANEDLNKITEEVESLKTALNRRVTPQTEEQAKMEKSYMKYMGSHGFLFKDGRFSQEADTEYKEGMLAYIRKGHEAKSLSVGSDPHGGYLVRPEVGELIDQNMVELSNFRNYMDVTTISTDAFEAPTYSGQLKARRVGEVTARNTRDDASGFGQMRIETPEMIASPEATSKFLEDASVNIEAWLAGEASIAFAEKEDEEIVLGNGVNQMRGFLTYSDTEIEQVNSGHASQLTADGLIDFEAKLKTGYKSGSVFFANRLTIAAVRKLKNGAGDYLWQPGLRESAANTLLGHPIAEAPQMPNVSAGNLAMAFGNFRRAYKIIERSGVRLLRDPYTNKPFVIFDFTKRIGGGVQVKEAMKILKVAAN